MECCKIGIMRRDRKRIKWSSGEYCGENEVTEMATGGSHSLKDGQNKY